MKTSILISSLLLAGASVAAAWGEPNPSHEHAGDVFRQFHGGQYCGSGVLHDGNSTGTTEQYGGGTTKSHRDSLLDGLTKL